MLVINLNCLILKERLDITTCNWGIRLERIDLDIKDMSKSLNNNFLAKFFGNAPKPSAPTQAPVAQPTFIINNITNQMPPVTH